MNIGVDSFMILFMGLLGESMLILQFIWFAPFLLLPMGMCFFNVFIGVRSIRRNYRRYPRTDT